MKKVYRVLAVVILVVTLVGLFAGCRMSERVAYNVSLKADNFGVVRKLTVMNVLSDTVVMELTGTFAIANNMENELEIVCKVGEGSYKKHFVYLNDWTLYTVEDISGADVDPFQYEIDFYPQMIPLTDTDIKFGG